MDKINRKFCFFDSESTGLSDRDEVIQLAGIVTDEKLSIVEVFNEYCFTNQTISIGALEVHGIDRKMLEEQSKGIFLEEKLSTFKSLEAFRENDMVFVGYNIAADIRFVNNTLLNNGCRPVDFGSRITKVNPFEITGRNHLCAMQFAVSVYGAGYTRKLQYIKNRLDITPEEFDKAYNLFTSKFKVKTVKSNLHDALYDSFLMWYMVALNKYPLYGI